MFTLGAFAIILNEKQELLLCHRTDYDLRNLPGGVVESGESPQDAVIREVKEETGLDVQVKELLGVYTKPAKNNVSFKFVCEVTGGEIALNDEADQILFFDKRKIPKNMSPNQMESIHDYFSDTKKPILKIQNGKGAIELIQEGKL